VLTTKNKNKKRSQIYLFLFLYYYYNHYDDDIPELLGKKKKPTKLSDEKK
jgi:hypothetical protein